MRASGWRRIEWFGAVAAALGVLAAHSARAQPSDNVLRPDEMPRTMLYRALERQAREMLATRRKEVASLKKPEAIRARQAKLRARFFEALGDLPVRTPLNARVIARAQRAGYRVERVIYESRPGHHVTAALYLPDSQPPFPGILVPCGHTQEGKAGETYQRACILLAKNGLAALCYDPIGQGERLQALDDHGKVLISAGSTTEHTLAGIGALLVGRSLAGYRVWDGIRSLDYLASRPEIDPARIGCTGNSGGGTMTAYLMALDDRVAVAAPSCYITSLERLFATIGPQDAEQNITGQVAFGMDHADYAILRAPKPTLFCVGTQDFFDIQGSWDTFREVKGIYGKLGFGERTDLFESDEPHGFTRPRREAAVRWMRRWLLKQDDAVVEPEFPVATIAQLQCTETGQVLSSLRGKSVFALNGERAAALARERARFQAEQGKEGVLRELKRLIGWTGSAQPARRSDRGSAQDGPWTVRKIVFETEPGIFIAAREYLPAEFDASAPIEIVVGDDRAQPSLAVKEAVVLNLRAGSTVLYVDLRGTGETAPAPADRATPFGAEWREAFLGLHIGRPLLGQRVGDLLSVVASVAPRARGGIRIHGCGNAGPVALHAALLEPRITSLSLTEMVTSWSDVAGAALSKDQLANAVPGALRVYDLPDLAAFYAPRQLAIAFSRDPAGGLVSQERVDAAYAACKAAYAGNHAASELSLLVDRLPARRAPLFQTLDLAVGETQSVTLGGGKTAAVKLISVREERDPLRAAVRDATVQVQVNGAPVTLHAGNYNLPDESGGVQIDCPITAGNRSNSTTDPWGLVKDARVRIWPAGSPWIEPDTFTLPARQRWMASSTQMANEPVYVDGCENPAEKKVYYHYGLDMGGAEGLVDVVAATDGVVVSAGTNILGGFEKSPAAIRYDVVYLLDDRGWYYRYSHMQTIDAAIKPGAGVRRGQKIGVLGKEGGSGGWSHLHVDITSRQPSGRWGIQEGYAFLWQTALREQQPELVAIARPHQLVRVGDQATFRGAKSWSRSNPSHRLSRFDWTFSDGTTATGAIARHTYQRPGSYCEILKVTDTEGRVAYDFPIVQVIDPAKPEKLPPAIHAAYAPTLGIKPGDPVTFKVRTFGTTDGEETWDFGDGTPAVTAHSDGNVDIHAKNGYAVTTHRFTKPGVYLVRVERANGAGMTATARLCVNVDSARN